MPLRRFVAVVVLGALVVGCQADDGTRSTVDLRPALAGDGDAGGAGGDAATNATVESVVMIGDSITKGSMAALQDRFEGLGLAPVMIEAENGKRMAVSMSDNPSGSSIAEFLTAASDGDHADELWVVALGTNDIAQYVGPDEIAAAVNEVLARIPEESPLVWVDTYFRDRPEQQELVNSIIRDRVQRRGNAVIAPWSAFAPRDEVVSRDGVHPTSDGTDVFAFVVTETARNFLGR